MKEKAIFMLIAILGIACFVLLGIFIAEKSTSGVILSLLGFFIVMSIGFRLKRKWLQM